jgi:hypothetical protein
MGNFGKADGISLVNIAADQNQEPHIMLSHCLVVGE